MKKKPRNTSGEPNPAQPAFIGYHYDIARGAYLTPEVFQEAVRTAAAAGFTHFLPYLEAMIRLPSSAKASPPCAYDADAWRRFESTAKIAGIELVPHFNVIGHTEQYARAYPELMANPHEPEMDATREEAQEWVSRCLREFCAFSTARHFLIGGDEWQAPNHRLADPGFNVAKTWAGTINRAVKCLAAEGRIPLVWHDMAIHYPEALDDLSREAVILFWFYDEDSDYPALDFFRRRGFRTIMAGGIIEGAITSRTAAGFDCAMAAARRHEADGIVMTSWEDGRWEFQRMNMVLTGRRLHGQPWPEAILRAGALRAALRRLPTGVPPAPVWQRQLDECLEAPEWQEFPEARAVFRAEQRGDRAEVARIYRTSHSPGGLGDRLEPPPAPRAKPATPPGLPAPRATFGLETDPAPAGSAVLRFRNGDEVFAVYTRYGGVLQDWRIGETVIIPHTVPGFLSSSRGKAAPGGYRSHGAAGLLPIWALGTHSNPCILWQYPYSWRLVESNADRVIVEYGREFPHVDYRCRIGMHRGTPGFWCEPRAVNRLAGPVAAGFSFNLALALDPEDAAVLEFAWEADRRHRSTIRETARSLVPIQARERLEMRSTRWIVTIRSDPAETAGYWADWAPGCFVTPDLHGAYHERQPGEETVVRWEFQARRISRA